MSKITVTHNPNESELEKLGVFNWPIWEKEESAFPWTYNDQETCYLLAGEVTVTPNGGEPVSFAAGDFVTFPAGMACDWDIKVAVKKHYNFS